MRWVGCAARQGEKMSVCEVLDTKPYRKRKLGKSGYRLEDDIKERLRGKQCGFMKLSRLAQSKIWYEVHLDTLFKLVGQKINKSFHFSQVVANTNKTQILENFCECKTLIDRNICRLQLG